MRDMEQEGSSSQRESSSSKRGRQEEVEKEREKESEVAGKTNREGRPSKKARKETPQQGRDKGKEKEKEQALVLSSSRGKEPDATPTIRGRNGVTEIGVMVRHPDSGNLIKVSDASNKSNRGVWNMARAAEKEGQEGGPATDLLVNIIKQAMEKGMRFNDYSRIPEWVVLRAKEQLRLALGEDRYEELVNTDHISSTVIESFQGNFQKNSLTVEQVPAWSARGGNYMEDLVSARASVTTVLTETLNQFHAFRTYVVWRVYMGTTVTRSLRRPAEEGEGAGEEIQEMRVTAFSSTGENGRMETIHNKTDIEEAIQHMYERLVDLMERYVENGSGWHYLYSMSVDVYNSKKLMGNAKAKSQSGVMIGDLAGGSWRPVPGWLTHRGVCNPKPPDGDNKCFIWAILRAFHAPPANTRGNQWNDLRKYESDIDLPEDFIFPVPIHNRLLREVEAMNEFSLSIFHIGKKPFDVSPLYITKSRKKDHVTLGLVEGAHYITITSLGKLFPQKGNRRSAICENCLNTFNSAERLEEHYRECIGMNEPTKIKMPVVGGKDHLITFKNWQYRLKAPFVIYADIEALLKEKTSNPDNVLHTHKPIAWAYKVVCVYPEHQAEFDNSDRGSLRSYCGENSMVQLLEDLGETAEKIEKLMYTNIPYDKKPGDQRAYASATTCHICEKDLNEEDNDRVLDHDHFTGKYRGAAHSVCNAMYSSCKYYKIPIIFHNLKGYDGYHILRGLKGFVGAVDKITCIAKNLDKFTSFTIDELRFIDSLAFFTGTSLESMVTALKKGKTKEQKAEVFKMVKETFHSKDSEKLELLIDKGVYPYEYMDSKAVLEETQLPPKEAFFSSLHGKDIERRDYERAQKVWEVYGCKTMEDYTMLYVKLDVILLAIVFEDFRAATLSKEGFGLDPVHFVTAPSLAWSAMLLRNWYNDVVIENMTDLEMFMMTQKGIRGGMCQVIKPYAAAKTCEETADGKERKIVYLDAVNLYGWGLSNKLYIGDARWEYNPEPQRDIEDDAEELNYRIEEIEELPPVDADSDDEEEEGLDEMWDRWVRPEVSGKQVYGLDLTEFDWEGTSTYEQARYIKKLDINGDRGYIFEVDINCPMEKHDFLNDYPPLPVSMTCSPSPLTKEAFAKTGVKLKADGTTGTKKLVLNLKRKRKYVIHLANLKQALDLGYELTKVHRVFSFAQSAWMKGYIDSNTEKRRKAKKEGNTALVVLFKLCNNAIYGKTVEDVQKRRNIKFFTTVDADKASQAASTPYVKCWKVLVEDELLIMEMAKHKVTMNRPIVIGFSVLELSKYHMFNFHYKQVKRYWGDNVKLLYTDTDSLVYKFKAIRDTVDNDMIDFQLATNSLDLSELPPDHLLRRRKDLEINEGIIGKFKDEMGGIRIIEFVALRCKMYSLRLEQPKDGKTDIFKMKGIKATATIQRTDEEHERYISEAPEEIEPEQSEKSAQLNAERRHLNHDDFVAVFRGQEGPDVEFVTLRQAQVVPYKYNALSGEGANMEEMADLYQMQTVLIKKKGLCNTDDKSWYLSSNNSLRYGHWKLH